MQRLLQTLVILILLVGFGAAKLSFEANLSKAMVDQQLLQPALKKGTSLQLGQTGAAVALGGLRSLVASIWSLRAFHHFGNLDWIKLEESYDVVTTLQPQTISYWKTGAWHLHTNASVYYNENKDLSPMRQSQMRQKYIRKGSAMLEAGVDQNPDEWKLHLELARLWSDSYKKPNLPRAVQHYKDTLASETLPDFERSKLQRFLFYTMTRSPEHAHEALKLGSELFHQSPRNRVPNLVCCLFALQNLLQPEEGQRIPEKELFPNASSQQVWLKNFWDYRAQGYPMNGVNTVLSKIDGKTL